MLRFHNELASGDHISPGVDMRNVAILGSTGSIGRQTIEVVRKNPGRFRAIALSAANNIALLQEQVEMLEPQAVCLSARALSEARRAFEGKVDTLLCGPQGLLELAAWPEADLIVNAVPGTAGLAPTFKALEAGLTLALANKESLVSGGELIDDAWRRQIVPIDSEASALFQCLLGEDMAAVATLMITGSGGPFRGRQLGELGEITPEQALAHPRWDMGPKVSIDSATLMNKGLEAIEAHYLFGVGYERIEVVIHPESIVHSLVEFSDGSLKAQLSATDMRIPIQYALSYPERLAPAGERLALSEIQRLTFEAPDVKSFPCLEYALEAGAKGLTFPAVLNGANEEAVAAFLAQQIPFTAIAKVVYETLAAHNPRKATGIDIVLEAEMWARERAQAIIKKSTF